VLIITQYFPKKLVVLRYLCQLVGTILAPVYFLLLLAYCKRTGIAQLPG